MKRVYLHIGTMKTGSSSIQETLLHNKKFFIDNKIYYCVNPMNYLNDQIDNTNNFNFDVMFINKNVYNLVTRFLEKNKMSFEEYKEGLPNCWDKEFKKAEVLGIENFIISSELLSSNFENIKTKDTLNSIKEYLRIYFDEIIVIGYIREFSSWISSQVQQHIRLGYTDNIAKEVTDSIKNVYFPNIDEWIEVFHEKHDSKFILREFNRETLFKNDIIEDFFNIINDQLNISDIKKINVNYSIGKDACSLLYSVNQKYPFLNDKHELNNNKGCSKIWIPEYLYRIEGYSEKFRVDVNLEGENLKQVEHVYKYANKILENSNLIIKNNKSNYEEIENYTVPKDYTAEVINNYNLEYERNNLAFQNLRKALAYNTNVEYVEIEKMDFNNKKIIEFNNKFGNIEHTSDNLYKITFKKELDIAEGYRELALCLEVMSDIPNAYKYMSIARILRPRGPFICQKCDEYRKQLMRVGQY